MQIVSIDHRIYLPLPYVFERNTVSRVWTVVLLRERSFHCIKRRWNVMPKQRADSPGFACKCSKLVELNRLHATGWKIFDHQHSFATLNKRSLPAKKFASAQTRVLVQSLTLTERWFLCLSWYIISVDEQSENQHRSTFVSDLWRHQAFDVNLFETISSAMFNSCNNASKGTVDRLC